MRGLIIAVALALLGPLAQARQDTVVSSEQASRMKDDYPFVRFSELAGFPVPALAAGDFTLSPHAAEPISTGELIVPQHIRALDGQRVSVRGYMLPVDVRGDRISAFLLTSSIDSCHFGMIGQANEWIMVAMSGSQTVPFPRSVPITVFGRLSVQPEVRHGGLVRLYSLTGDAIAVH
jgi:hypothetical protein